MRNNELWKATDQESAEVLLKRRWIWILKNLNHFCFDCHSVCDNVYRLLTMFSALAAVCTVDCATEIVLITLHYITWIGHRLKKPRDNIARKALQWNPQGQRKRDRPKNTWRGGVEQEMKEAGVTWGSL